MKSPAKVELVSWSFEPYQPQKITSGLRKKRRKKNPDETELTASVLRKKIKSKYTKGLYKKKTAFLIE